MLEKLKKIEKRYDDIAALLSDPSVISDINNYTALIREQKQYELIVEKFRQYTDAEKHFLEAGELMNDSNAELKELAAQEYKETRQEMDLILKDLKKLLLPAEENDQKNVIIEIRGGAGGEEATLFAAALFRMYSMYAESKNYRLEVLNLNETELGGIKEIAFCVNGKGAFSRYKYESGVHRVQRVPETENGGRIHTSTATVAVLPEIEEVEFQISPADLQIDTFRSSGAGGQHVNKTESAIRITHLPTGIVVECQDERSQYKNKDRAMKILRSRLADMERKKRNESVANERKSQVGTGDRSERIRTYNFPQGRVTDHRIGLTLYKIDQIMDGDLDELIDALITSEQAEKLKGEGEE